MLESFFTALGINKVSLIFGFLGAILHALRERSKHWVERVIAFMIGCVMASIGPTLIVKYFNLDPDPAYFGGLGFVLGYFGMSLVDGASDLLKSFRGLDWKDIFTGWFKRGGGQ